MRGHLGEATVYRVNPDPEKRCLQYDMRGTPPPTGRAGFFGEPRIADWLTQDVYVDNLAADAPDIWFLNVANLLVFTEQLGDELEPFLAMAGERLPLRNVSSVDATRDLFALNITNLVDAIDMHRSDLNELAIYPDFIEQRLGEPTLFIVPHLAATIFCLDWSELDDSIKRRIDDKRLTGIEFQEVWSSATGPGEINLVLA